MPNSKNQLCTYHLVSKGLKKLKSQLLGWDRTVVKNQVATFKHWIFSWMKFGGIETEQ